MTGLGLSHRLHSWEWVRGRGETQLPFSTGKMQIMEGNPCVVIARRAWVWAGTTGCAALPESLTRASRANGKGFASKVQTGKLFRVGAKGLGSLEKFLE